MPKKVQRIKTNYPGVYFIMSKAGDGRPEKIFYVIYRRDGKLIEEKAGRQFKDSMTPARASHIRARRMEGKAPSNREKREAAKQTVWIIDNLWEEYRATTSPDLTDRGRYKNYLKPSLGNKQPQEIAPLDVERLRIKLAKTLGPQTVKHVLMLLKRVTNFGVNNGLAPGLPFKPKMPKVNNLKTEDLTEEQMANLITAIDTDYDEQTKNFMRMVLFTGMRRGELFKLQWRDVDFDRGFITIRDPKGGKDQHIPLNQAAREVLENHHRDESSPFVFPGRGGNQRKNNKRQVNRIKERAGLPKDFRPLHGLRHVFASMLASSGQVDLYTLQKLLTHKTPTMTQRYAHLRDDALKRASELAGDIVGKVVNGKNQNKNQKVVDK